MNAPDILEAVQPVTRALDALGVTYFIGGSVASSAYGKARSTLDVDIVADLRHEHVAPLVEALRCEYYIDEQMIHDAIVRRSSANVIHLATMIKVDIFVLKTRGYDQEAVRRKRVDTLDEQHGSARVFLASPEDVILNKLEWFRLGSGISERQWGDVVGVIRVQGPSLDTAYLRRWATELGLSDLLADAFREAGLPL
jgi:hypothetical protein